MMAQHYSNPKRANDEHALPDVETFYLRDAEERSASYGEALLWDWTDNWPDAPRCIECGEHRDSPEHNYQVALSGTEHEFQLYEPGWYWQSCFPGCLPNGEPNGPFDTEELALADAREGVDDASDDYPDVCADCEQPNDSNVVDGSHECKCRRSHNDARS